MKDKQYSLTIEITNNTDRFVGEPLFITGNFNHWIPDALPLGTIPNFGESKQYVLHDLKAGSLEFRITRGSWTTLTSSKNGKLEAPYAVAVGRDSNLKIRIDAWRDMFPSSTASPQVHVLDEKFFLLELKAYRKVWIYLPKTYHTAEKRYPVLYMHDGQHLFDEATSTGRTGPIEWEVDEAIDVSPHDAIVVAIASATDPQIRKRDYLLNTTDLVVQPQGRAYLASIVNRVKPYIDERYRTLPDVKHTAMAGSSLGGLLTIYAGLLYPDVFGSLGVFSPSIWADDKQQLISAVEERLQNPQTNALKQYYYLYGGKLERRPTPLAVEVDMVENMQHFASLLQKERRFEIAIDIDPWGKHGAWYWRKAFPRFYEWWHKTLL